MRPCGCRERGAALATAAQDRVLSVAALSRASAWVLASIATAFTMEEACGC